MTGLSDRLAGRVAIVTGAGSGIGRQVVLHLARAGVRVAAVDVRGPSAEETAGLVAEGTAQGAALVDRAPEVLTLEADVRSEQQTAAMAEAVLERFGRIDLLVACAGILRAGGARPKPLAETTSDEWHQVLETNLTGTFLSNRAVLPTMIRQRSGQIINVSSTSGLRGRALDAPYCASKFGIVGLTESLAEEVRHHGIRVQVIHPDAVDTPLWRQNGPFGPPADALAPERVAEVVILLAALPEDTVLHPGVLAPARRGRGGRAPRARAQERSAIVEETR